MKYKKDKYMKLVKLLYGILAVVSFGFYVHPLSAFECPGHPRDAEEIQRENDDYRYKDMKDLLDAIDPENAPHSTEEAKNFASINQ